jgi:hypothetical protein
LSEKRAGELAVSCVSPWPAYVDGPGGLSDVRTGKAATAYCQLPERLAWGRH